MPHRIASKFGYYSLSGFAGSALVQLAVIWPQTWIAVGAIGAIALLYFAFLLICIKGVLQGKRWAGVAMPSKAPPSYCCLLSEASGHVYKSFSQAVRCRFEQ